MDFKKKLKTRLYVAIIYMALGIMMIVGSTSSKTNSDFISSFGLCLVIMGIVRIRNYFTITKNDEPIRKQEIAETDERNLSIINRAKSVTFTVYVLFSGTAMIILSLFNLHESAKLIAYSMLSLVTIYWISYLIIRKKS